MPGRIDRPAVDRVLQHVVQLVDLPGAPGHEDAVARYVSDALAPFGEVSVDVHGSVVAALGADEAAPRLVLVAHMDEVALVVRAVEPDGFLRVAPLGSLHPACATGRVVRVGTVLGVVGIRAGHYRARRDAPPDHHDLYVDVGASDAEEVARAGIVVGTPVTLAEPLQRFGRDSAWWVGHALDNRVGVALLLTLVERLAGEVLPWRWYAAFSVQEENGLRGASRMVAACAPDVAIAVDTIVSGDTPDLEAAQDTPFRVGHGPVLPVATGTAGTGHVVPRRLLEHLEAVAASAAVTVQRAVMTHGDNDATALTWSTPGALAASIAVPRRYAHSAVETLHAGDVAAAYAWLEAIVRTPVSDGNALRDPMRRGGTFRAAPEAHA